MSSSAPALKNLLAHCAAVKAAAIDAGGNSPLSYTISRYLSKAALVLEALIYQAEGVLIPSDDIIDDFFDAVNAISDAVSSISHMSRLQALFQAEDIRDNLKAAAADLRAAVATLAPLTSYLPVDAKEDFTVLERQLASMKLTTRPSGILAAQNLLYALTLDQEKAINLTTATAVDTNTTNGTESAVNYSIQSALQTALSQAGLSSFPAENWLDRELLALAQGIVENLNATEVQDPIDAFHLRCAAAALLKQAAMDRLYRTTSTDEGNVDDEEETVKEEPVIEEDVAWEKLVVGGNVLDSMESNQKNFLKSNVLASTFHLTRQTRGILETALQSVGSFTAATSEVKKLSIEEGHGLCQALTLTEDSSSTTTSIKCNGTLKVVEDNPSTPSHAVLLRQYKAAVLLSYAAESHGSIQKLLAAGAIPALLTALETSHHSSIRIAAANALRKLCRDSAAREAAASAGCLRPLARLLQSSHAAVRRAAARAFSNIIVAGEQFKRDAVEKYSIPGSLIAMLRADDALGQEAAALAIANLAANSETVQILLGKTDVFNPLSEVLHSAMTTSALQSSSVSVAQHAAARAVRNLTSRVQFNRLKASAAGTVPGLVALLHSSESTGRSIAASALATVMDGCSDALSQAVHAGATTELCRILQEDSTLACRDAAACALVHIVQANALQQQHYSTNNTGTATTGTGTIPSATNQALDLVSVGISSGALPALLGLLSNGTPSGRHAAARLVVFLAKYKNKDAVVAAGAVSHLVPLLSLQKTKQDSVRRQAATALCVLMHRCDAARRQFLDAQGIQLVVSLLTKKSTQKTADSSSSLSSSSPAGGASNGEAKAAIAASGEVEEGTRQEAARLVGILCANNTFNQGAIAADAGAITALVDIIKHPNKASIATQEAAAVALSNLACLPSNQTALAAAEAGHALLQLLDKDATPTSSHGCRIAAARALSNMVADGMPEELQRSVSEMVQLLTELAIPVDEKLMQKIPSSTYQHQHQNNTTTSGPTSHSHHNEFEHQIAAACALGNIACADQYGSDAVAKYGGAAVLARLCQSEVPSVREAAVQGLWESSRGSVEARHVAVQEQVVPWLVQILIVGEDPAKEAASGCLAELTRCGEIVCAAAEEAGALLLLQQLADHGSVDVAGAAAAALKALQRRSPDSPSLENELSQRLSSMRELGSRRFDSGGEASSEDEDDEEKEKNGQSHDDV